MVSKPINYKVKDTLFTFIFKDIKYQRKLYASLHDDEKSYSDEDFNLITLENVFANDVYNDLGLLVGDRLIILLEAQSTFNPNMGIRFLIYVAKTYQDYIDRKALNIYGTKKITLPKPEFILVYTGIKKLDIKSFNLSDSYEYEGLPPLELNINVINSETVKESILKEYISFCQLFDNFKKDAKTEKEKLENLKKTIKYCIENGILKEILLTREMEVEEIMLTLFSQEKVTDLMLRDRYNDGLEQGLKQGEKRGLERGLEQGEKRGLERGLEQGEKRGLERGKYENSILIAKNLKNNKVAIGVIVNATGLTKQQVEAL